MTAGTISPAAEHHVLLIAYEYPPIGGTGMVRVLKFSKYLEQFGWQPHVLTVRNRDRFYTTPSHDQPPAGVTVHRAFNPLNNLSVVEGGLRRLGVTRRVLVPDVFLGWVPAAVRTAGRIIETERIDVVYVTCPPFSAARIGARLRQRTGVPFVLDLRDAWTPGPHPVPYLHPALRRREERQEREAMTEADWVVTATPGIRDAYLERYPFIRDRSSTILNGFDMDDIPAASEPFPKFTIAYTGFFYGARSPDRFIAALGRIVREQLIPLEQIQFVWAGRPAPAVWDLIRKEGVECIVDYVGLVSKAEADALLYRSHLLFFLPFAEVEQGADQQVLTGKIFPYLASGRPLLALVPEGDAKEMIAAYSDNSYVITNGEVDDIVEAIIDAYRCWRSGELSVRVGPRTDVFRRLYNYRKRTRELSAVFDSLT